MIPGEESEYDSDSSALSDIEAEPVPHRKRRFIEPFWPDQNFDLKYTKRQKKQRRKPPVTPRASSVAKRKFNPQQWERDNFDVYLPKRVRRRGNNIPIPPPQRRVAKRVGGEVDIPDRVRGQKNRKQEFNLAQNLHDRTQRKRKAVNNIFSNVPVPRKKPKWESVTLR